MYPLADMGPWMDVTVGMHPRVPTLSGALRTPFRTPPSHCLPLCLGMDPSGGHQDGVTGV